MTDDERQRLDGVYSDYERAQVQQRWDRTNPGNAEIVSEQVDVIAQLLRRAGVTSATSIMDLGAGSASTIPLLTAFRQGSVLISVDILENRVRQAADVGEHDAYVVGDGSKLPFRSSSFQAVGLFTVLSSILSSVISERLASEVNRVLVPGGALLFYDMRVPNPSNSNLRHLRAREWSAMFPDYEAHVRSLTLLPPLARRLGRATKSAYPALARLPFLRTHLAGVLVKPPDTR